MSGYRTESYKSTSSGAIVWLRCGTLATVLAISPVGAEEAVTQPYSQGELVYGPYNASSLSGTAATMTVSPRKGVSDASPQFEEAVSRFYSELAGSQEPLGAEFADVLADNLWDLYVRV